MISEKQRIEAEIKFGDAITRIVTDADKSGLTNSQIIGLLEIAKSTLIILLTKEKPCKPEHGCVEPVLMAIGLGEMRAALELPPREEEPQPEEEVCTNDSKRQEEEQVTGEPK